MLDRIFKPGSCEVCYLWVCSLLWMDFWAAAMQKPVNHVSVFICVIQTQQHKFTAKSACLHMFWLWLRHKNKPSVYHLFVCVRVRPGTLDICYFGSFTTYPPCRREWWKANLYVHISGYKKKKKNLWKTFSVSPVSTTITAFNLDMMNLNWPGCTSIQ